MIVIESLLSQEVFLDNQFSNILRHDYDNCLFVARYFLLSSWQKSALLATSVPRFGSIHYKVILAPTKFYKLFLWNLNNKVTYKYFNKVTSVHDAIIAILNEFLILSRNFNGHFVAIFCR